MNKSRDNRLSAEQKGSKQKLNLNPIKCICVKILTSGGVQSIVLVSVDEAYSFH